MQILVVDDMVSMRHVMIHMLKGLGYTSCDEATDGVHAIKLLRAKPYDLVITDFHMPKLNGKELLCHIRKDDELHALPVLMVTCEDTKANVTSIIESKVNGFIVKPFNANTLKKQIGRILEKVKNQSERVAAT